MKKVLFLVFTMVLIHPKISEACNPDVEGCNLFNEIGIYYMNVYRKHNGVYWKSLVPLMDYNTPENQDPRNPYYQFYEDMKTRCYEDASYLPTQARRAALRKCAHIRSLRRKSGTVTSSGSDGNVSGSYEGYPWNTMIGYVKPHNIIKYTSDDTDKHKGWGTFDLVFFYGHNAHAIPTYSNLNFGYWTHDATNDTWTYHVGNWENWGTPSMPYYYHHGDPIVVEC